MKKLLFMLICIFISIPTMASAHTHLSSSNPTEGQVVTEELKEITLDYAGDIEKLSTMKLLKDGVEVPLSQILVQDKQMVGTLSAPLENGSYIIDWNIVGEDGHPITGKVSFTVQIEQMNDKNETPPKVEENKQENEQQDKIETQTEEQTEDQTSTNTVTTIITVLLFAILVMGLVVLFKKKRK